MEMSIFCKANVNAHKVVRINVKTWYDRIFVKKIARDSLIAYFEG